LTYANVLVQWFQSNVRHAVNTASSAAVTIACNTAADGSKLLHLQVLCTAAGQLLRSTPTVATAVPAAETLEQLFV
jgi:hypothetical protein